MPCPTSAIGAYSRPRISSAGFSVCRAPIFTTASVAPSTRWSGPNVSPAPITSTDDSVSGACPAAAISRSARAISAWPARRALPPASMPENIAVVITR